MSNGKKGAPKGDGRKQIRFDVMRESDRIGLSGGREGGGVPMALMV